MALWGAMLSGLNTGLQNYQASQEDLAYTRQVRAQELQKGQLANQAQEVQNQQQQQVLQNADLTRKYWVNALQDDSAPPTQQGQQAAQQAAPATAAGAPQGGQQPSFKPVGPLSMDQLAALDKKYNQPIGTTYGLMAAESSGKPNAQGPELANGERAEGLFQVRPSTAAQPGYGLKPFKTSDPDGAMGYYAQMAQKAGGDPAKALAYWNAGPGGNPDNPETKAFIPKVQKGQQQFAAAYQLDQSKQQPTPADNINAREQAGVNTPAPVYQQAAQAQAQQVKTMLAAAQAAQKDGHPELAQQFYDRAQTLQTQQQEVQQKAFTAQKDANKETAELAVGVKDQSSYNGFRAQLQQNPAMQAAVAGLGLTGDYAQDRNKIETLASRTETLKDQHANAIKEQEFQLKQRVEQQKEQKVEQVKVASAQAVQADSLRTQANTPKGIPTTPSLAVTMPGATPKQLQDAKQKIDKDRAPFIAGIGKTLDSTRNVDAYSKEVIALLNPKAPGGAVSTGGFWSANVPGVGTALTSMEQSRQQFAKAAVNLVNAQQATLIALGAGRSAGTAAMSNILSQAKPNVENIDNKTNMEMAQHIYIANQLVKEQATFQSEFMRANPSATSSDASLEWQRFENTLGDMTYEDPEAPTRMRFNDKVAHYNTDGSVNPHWVDWREYYRNNPE
jgi:hypothetical protein